MRRRGDATVTASMNRKKRHAPEPVNVVSSPAEELNVVDGDVEASRAMLTSRRVDFLVIGSGISGLSYALEAAGSGKVAIVTKDVAYEGSTFYAQGGISAVIDPNDTVEEHIKDTHVAGDFLCDEGAVEVVCREGKEAVDKLIEFGANFTKDNQGKLHLAREGGHSKHRIVHAADMTGKEIERALLESAKAHPNIEFYEYHMAQDLITVTTGEGEAETTTCIGATVVCRDTGQEIRLLSCCTLLASGGAGQLFPSTTNPTVSTGDGVAMAVRGKAVVANMEFYQFHPTSLYTGPGGAPKRNLHENAFLVTEAVRGHGGRLFNYAGERFMAKYDDRLELAPRDVVARSIDCEIKAAKAAGSEAACVYLDVSHLPEEDVLTNFPGIAAELKTRGINMASDRIPVVPAAHYLCGGILTNLNGESSIGGLFACGETACTGVHGANRLASNSLLEAVVFANRSVRASRERFADRGVAQELEPFFRLAEEEAAAEEVRRVAEAAEAEALGNATDSSYGSVWFDGDVEWARLMRADVQRIMWDAAGIVRNTAGFDRAIDELEEMLFRCEVEIKAHGRGLYAQELRNLLTVGLVTLRCASMRRESRGLHYNVDYPDRVEEERHMTLITPDMFPKLGKGFGPR